MDYVAAYYAMTSDKLSNEIMNLHKKLSKINSQSPMYNQVLELIQTAEAINREKIELSRFTAEDKVDKAIEIGSVDSVVYTPIYSQEEFLEVVAKMYLDKGKQK